MEIYLYYEANRMPLSRPGREKETHRSVQYVRVVSEDHYSPEVLFLFSSLQRYISPLAIDRY